MLAESEANPPAAPEQASAAPALSISLSVPNAPMDAFLQCAHLADVPLKVEALLDCLTLNLEAIAALEVGSIILLNRSAGDNVDLHVNGVPLASGEIMAVENKAGVQITDFVHSESPSQMES